MALLLVQRHSWFDSLPNQNNLKSPKSNKITGVRLPWIGWTSRCKGWWVETAGCWLDLSPYSANRTIDLNIHSLGNLKAFASARNWENGTLAQKLHRKGNTLNCIMADLCRRKHFFGALSVSPSRALRQVSSTVQWVCSLPLNSPEAKVSASSACSTLR